MLEEKRSELHEKAKSLAFHHYVRSGQIPPFLAGLVDITSSAEVFEQACKYSPDQPRVPAGNGQISGQWTDGGEDANANDTNLISARKKDPGAIPVQLNDGSVVGNPTTGEPLLMPKDVSLANNALMGETIGTLPIGLREAAMYGLFDTGQSMDYQRLYDDGQFNKTYTDFGNYNYGMVAAAAGYTLDQAMSAAGWHNSNVNNTDQSGAHGTDASENTFIPMGYQDYTSGRIDE